MADIIPFAHVGDDPGDSMSAEELEAAGRERDPAAQIAAAEAAIASWWDLHLPLAAAARSCKATTRALEILKSWVRSAIAAP